MESKYWNKLFFTLLIVSLLIISGCIGKINKNEAEKIAVSEAKSVFRNFITNADAPEYWQLLRITQKRTRL